MYRFTGGAAGTREQAVFSESALIWDRLSWGWGLHIVFGRGKSEGIDSLRGEMILLAEGTLSEDLILLALYESCKFD